VTQRKEDSDIDWDYWDAQIEGFKEAFKKPIWRDYLQTQKSLMDDVHDFFWKEKEENNQQSIPSVKPSVAFKSR
jgi:hypothetical protein